MKKLYQLLANERQKGDVGIEIECEGRDLQVAIGEVWNTVNDGSLRGMFPNEKCEYVLRKPLPLKEVKQALLNLAEINKDAKLDFSFRTSVHVHVNVQELTEDELLNLVYTYALLEDALVSYCGKERKCNRFCLRMQDAEGILAVVAGFIENGIASLLMNHEGEIRYSALNLAAVAKYGSVEFRSMRGTLDIGVITNWVESLVAIREFAKKFANVLAVQEFFMKNGAKVFMEEVLGDYAPLYEYKGYEHDILKCFSLSYDIPCAYEMKIKRAQEKEEEKPILKRQKINFKLPPRVDELPPDFFPAAPVFINLNRP